MHIEIKHIETEVERQFELAQIYHDENAVLLTEWVAEEGWYTLYLSTKKELYCVRSQLKNENPYIVDLTAVFPVCARLQRAIFDLNKVPTQNTVDTRPWLIHDEQSYNFVKVGGEGVHEIPVGPIHAGIIEPGHFRFSVVGERVLKLEQRLGYTHKGIHQLLKNKSLEEGSKIIGRVSGDNTVAYAYAFAMACEQAVNAKIPFQISLLRGILLERERIVNHISDIGAIANDAGLPTLQASFNILKENFLQKNKIYANHRYLMDCILPFKNNIELSKLQLEEIRTELVQLSQRLKELECICQTHIGLQDRLQNTGIVTTALAMRLQALGIVAKASGFCFDVRKLLSIYPYSHFPVTNAETTTGDVAARVSVRFKESFESIELIRQFSRQLLSYSEVTRRSAVIPRSAGFGIGCVEGWRGPITVIVAIENNNLQWCHFHDPSWQNWPTLEYAVLNNIVADFPLINKSLNLSYSGHDS